MNVRQAGFQWRGAMTAGVLVLAAATLAGCKPGLLYIDENAREDGAWRPIQVPDRSGATPLPRLPDTRPARPTPAGRGLDLRVWLDQPGVQLVAVEFYATWCKPCVDAVPRWRALHERYRGQGLRLLVVNTQDPDGRCINPGWNPDKLICDVQGHLARQFGVGNRLPSAFLWSWRGDLLVGDGHVAQVEQAIKVFVARTPRVEVGATGPMAQTLGRLVRDKLLGRLHGAIQWPSG